jgi:hypothetical protein
MMWRGSERISPLSYARSIPWSASYAARSSALTSKKPVTGDEQSGESHSVVARLVAHQRICEQLEVKFPGPPRHLRTLDKPVSERLS